MHSHWLENSSDCRVPASGRFNASLRSVLLLRATRQTCEEFCCDFCLCLQLLWMVIKILGSSCCFLSFLQLMLYCLFRKKRVSLEDISIFSALLLQTHAWGLFVFSLADANESVDEHEIELYLYRICIYAIDVEHCNIRHGHCLSGWIGYASSWK